MAEDNSVKIKVILDTDEARARLSQLKEELGGLGNGINVGNGNGSNGGIGQQASPKPARDNANGGGESDDEKEAKRREKEAEKAARKAASEFRKAIKGSGLAIGVEFASMIIEISRREFVRWKNLEFKADQRVGQDNAKSRIEQAKFNRGEERANEYGAIGKSIMNWGKGIIAAGGATAATGIGAPIGVKLAIVGGAVTAIGKGVEGIGRLWGRSRGEKEGEIDQMLTERNRVDQIRDQFDITNRRMSSEFDQFRGNAALERMLEYAGSRQSRLNILSNQQRELMYGDGESSIKNLMVKSEWYKNNKKTESVEFRDNEAKLAMQRERLQELKKKEFEEQYLTQRVKPMEGSEVADSFAQKGLYVGAQIDVGAANKPVVDELKRINERLYSFLSKASGDMGKRNEVGRDMERSYRAYFTN